MDPINLVQIELLRRLAVLRDEQERDPARDEARARTAAVLRKALKITISGVAAGMRNTG